MLSGEPCAREFGGRMNRIVRFWWFIVAFPGTLLMSGRADMFVALTVALPLVAVRKRNLKIKRK